MDFGLLGPLVVRDAARHVAVSAPRQRVLLAALLLEAGRVASLDALEGVEVTDLDPRTRRQLDIPNSTRGALVTNVEQDSNASEAGLRPGDVILEIDRQPVRNADDAVALSQKAKGERVLLRVWSNGGGGGQGGTRYIVVDSTKR